METNPGSLFLEKDGALFLTGLARLLKVRFELLDGLLDVLLAADVTERDALRGLVKVVHAVETLEVEARRE